jgi:hypothetical protein
MSEDDAVELVHTHLGKYGALIQNNLEDQLLFGQCPVLVYLKNL